MEKKKFLIENSIRCLIVILCALGYSISVLWFLEPAGLISIGLTGVSQILNRLFVGLNVNIPIGVFNFVLNIPVLLYGYKHVSPRFVLFSVLSVITQSILLLGFIPTPNLGINPETDTLFMSIIGALGVGASIGIALRFGTSTGGIDILAQVLNLKNGISIGIISMMVNISLAIIAGGIMLGKWDVTLYTFIYIILSNIVVDKIHTSYNYLRIDVVTTKGTEVSKSLIDGMHRGCTLLNAKGAYTNEDKHEILMVISSYELDKARRIIHSIDPSAFIMVLPVKRIIGAFFKHTII
jgi:uncharacterized membrane-anchored protein YitT (DUF2179 family)